MMIITRASFRWRNAWALAGGALIIGMPLACLLAQQREASTLPAITGQTAPDKRTERGVIKVEASSVLVDVIVTDKKGHHVGGLTPSDFVVYDNDVRQQIATFVPPESTAQHAAVTPESAQPGSGHATETRRSETPNAANVRFITLVLDLGGLQPGSIGNAREAAVQYLQKTVAKEDFVAVYRVDHSLHLDVLFTQDKQRAIAAMRQAGHRAPTGAASAPARLETEQNIHELESEVYGFGSAAGPGAGQASSLGRGAAMFAAQELASLRAYLWTQSIFQARAIFVALRAIAEAYRDMPGRKNVVVFSEGFIHSPEAKTEMAAVIDAANRANVAFYIVDAGGLTAGFDAANGTPDPAGTREAYQTSQEGAGFFYGFSEFDHLQRLGGQDMLHDDLGQVAVATGGLYIKNQNDLLRGLALADNDLREFYTLVYQPTDKRFDGSFHKIKVEVLKPGYSVRYRRGYWAIPPGQELMVTPAAAQLIAAVESGSLKSVFSPAVNAALLLAADGKLAMPTRVSIPGKLVKFEKDGNIYRAPLTLVLIARDASGRAVSVHQRFLNLQFDNNQRKDFEKKDLEINARLAAPHLEALDVQAILQLPDGTAAVGDHKVIVATSVHSGPELTSVLLSNSIEPAKGAGDLSDPLRGENFQLNFVEPRFASSDKLTVYFGILLDGPATSASRVRLSYRIDSTERSTKVLVAEDLPVSPTQRSIRVLKQFDLEGLPAGRHTFEVTAKDLAHGGMTSQRSDFEIR